MSNLADLSREAVKIVDDSPDTVLAEMIADYEQRTAKPCSLPILNGC